MLKLAPVLIQDVRLMRLFEYLMLELSGELGGLWEPDQHGSFGSNAQALVEDLYDDARFRPFLVCSDSQICGFMVLSTLFAGNCAFPIAEIHELYILPCYRRRGKAREALRVARNLLQVPLYVNDQQVRDKVRPFWARMDVIIKKVTFPKKCGTVCTTKNLQGD